MSAAAPPQPAQPPSDTPAQAVSACCRRRGSSPATPGVLRSIEPVHRPGSHFPASCRGMSPWFMPCCFRSLSHRPPPVVSAAQVGNQFVSQYYTVQHASPKHLHRFYSEASTLTYGEVRPEGFLAKQATGQKVWRLPLGLCGQQLPPGHAAAPLLPQQRRCRSAVLARRCWFLQPSGRCCARRGRTQCSALLPCSAPRLLFNSPAGQQAVRAAKPRCSLASPAVPAVLPACRPSTTW